MNTNKLFYFVKPIIPRLIQIEIRRYIAKKIRKQSTGIWPINPGITIPPPKWNGWPDGKEFAFVLQHDVDTQKGHDSCHYLMDIEEKLGVRSCFFFIPERYSVSKKLLAEIKKRGFGLGVHGLKHDGKLFSSYEKFRKNAARINGYLHDWNVSGFSSPSMISRLEWMYHLNIDFSTSSFDTDPFEPQPVAVNTIFPFIVNQGLDKKSFVELPYTLPQDFTLYIILKEATNEIWKRKLDWIARNKGMALLNTHPDYMDFKNSGCRPRENYPVRLYSEFISYVQNDYAGRFWSAQSEDVSAFVKSMKKDRL